VKDDLEAELRSALRPVAPDDDFTQRLIAQVTSRPRASSGKRVISRHRRAGARWWLSGSVAAAVLIGIGVQDHLQSRQRDAGLRAKQQVIEALRLTNQKLDIAFQAVRDQSSSLEEKAGL
jgi:anti-sigma factor RsiW